MVRDPAPLEDRGDDRQVRQTPASAGADDGLVDAHSGDVGGVAYVRQVMRHGDQRLQIGDVDVVDAGEVGGGVGGLDLPAVAWGLALQCAERGFVGLDVARLAAKLDHHIGEHEPLVHAHRSHDRAGELNALIDRGVLAIALQDAQRNVLGRHPRRELAMDVEADDLGHAHPVGA